MKSKKIFYVWIVTESILLAILLYSVWGIDSSEDIAESNPNISNLVFECIKDIRSNCTRSGIQDAVTNGMIEAKKFFQTYINNDSDDLCDEPVKSEESVILSKLGIPSSTEKEQYVSYVYDICGKYDIADGLPELILSIMKAESNFNPNVRSYAGCVGLMQISPYWHADRAYKLGLTNFWDPYSNIYIAVDFINDLYFNYANESIELTVMMYNMDFASARKLYSSGTLTRYASTVLSTQEQLRR